jgi:hypothetical protein
VLDCGEAGDEQRERRQTDGCAVNGRIAFPAGRDIGNYHRERSRRIPQGLGLRCRRLSPGLRPACFLRCGIGNYHRERSRRIVPQGLGLRCRRLSPGLQPRASSVREIGNDRPEHAVVSPKLSGLRRLHPENATAAFRLGDHARPEDLKKVTGTANGMHDPEPFRDSYAMA